MSTPPPQEPGEPPRALVAALRRILSPLVRLMLTHGVTYPALCRTLKGIFVDVAEQHFALDGRRQSDSRVSMLTGVHRKDVRALRGAPRERTAVPDAVSLGSQLVARWLSEPAYRDREGTPLVLPRRASRGPSFDKLASAVSRQDVKPRVLLDELLRLGVVEALDDGAVCLKVEAFVPRQGFDEMAYYLGRNVGEHLEAGVHNLQGDATPFMERAVAYQELSETDSKALRALSERLATDALKTVNRKALSAKKRSAGKADARHRLIFGVYLRAAPMDTDEEDPT